MKKVLLLVLLVFIGIQLNADVYQVSVKSNLNVRCQPSASAPLIGTLANGTRLSDVHCHDNGWAEINYNGQKGYVKSSYLLATEGEETLKPSGKSKFDILNYDGPLEKKWMVFVILGCIAIMWFLCKFVREVSAYAIFDSGSSLTDGLMTLNCCLTIFTSVFIFYYTYVMGGNALWFLFPSIVNGPLGGWLYAFLNFVFFVYALINLLVNFIKTMDDFSHSFNRYIDIRFGLIGWGIGIVGFIIFYYIGNDEWTQWFIVAVLCWQLIQVVLIWLRGWNGDNMLGLFAASAVYVVGALGIIVIAIPAVMMLFVLVIVGGVLTAFVNSNDSPSRTRPGSVPYGHQVLVHHNGAGEPYYIGDDGKSHRLSGSGGTYIDDQGNAFDENGFSKGWN